MENFFKLKENGTTFSTEVIAGLTTFFAMAYIIAVNPSILSTTGMPWGAVFLATIIAAIIGTLIMGLFANVPYAQAPGMGMNAFFTFTVCKGLGFTWQQALSMVFICGIFNIIITVTSLRKLLITSIPEGLQHAIGGGIGIFVAYVGLCNIGVIHFLPDPTAPAGGVPSLAVFNSPSLWLFLIGLTLTIFFLVAEFKGNASIISRGGFLLAIVITSLIGIPMGVTHVGNQLGIGAAFQQLPETFMVIFKPEGLPSLFTDPAKIPLVLVTIFAFSLADMFDTIGTFIGTGRRSGIFSEQDIAALENSKGFNSKMEKALFADATATLTGSLVGTSNTTTFVESAAGIASGGRTGLTSVVVAICFALSTFFAPLFSAIPSAATAPVLVIVGCMMMSAVRQIHWDDMTEAVPAFFASVFMAFSYSISYGIAAAFITYCLTMTFKKRIKDIHPVIWLVAGLFVLNFVLMATMKA